MAILPILTLSHSTWYIKDFFLRQKSKEIDIREIKEKWLKDIIFDMFETLYSTPSGVGLAAPQIGVLLKLIVIDIKRNGKKPIILINPEYTSIGNEIVSNYESCLSVPNLKGKVERYESILLKYYDINGDKIEKICTGFESKVFQHEIDHLNGILYVDKVKKADDIVENLGVPNNLAKNVLNNL